MSYDPFALLSAWADLLVWLAVGAAVAVTIVVLISYFMEQQRDRWR